MQKSKIEIEREFIENNLDYNSEEEKEQKEQILISTMPMTIARTQKTCIKYKISEYISNYKEEYTF